VARITPKQYCALDTPSPLSPLFVHPATLFPVLLIPVLLLLLEDDVPSRVLAMAERMSCLPTALKINFCVAMTSVLAPPPLAPSPPSEDFDVNAMALATLWIEATDVSDFMFGTR